MNRIRGGSTPRARAVVHSVALAAASGAVTGALALAVAQPRALFVIWVLASLLILATVAALSFHGALRDVEETVRLDERLTAEAAADLCHARNVEIALARWREEMAHDAHNACAGLRAVLLLLERCHGRLDEAHVGRLRAAALQEIGCLEQLMTGEGPEAAPSFEVTGVVAAVVEARRALGAEIILVGTRCTHARGRPGDLANVVRNLLVNAEAHAAGSPVVVNIVEEDGTVAVLVTDQGPGVGADVAARAFDRGVRGPTSEGSGLGLYVARSQMRAQGGDLRLCSSRLGAAFEMTLPSAKPPTSTPQVPRQRNPAPLGPRP